MRMKLQSLVFPDLVKSDFPNISAEAWALFSAARIVKPSLRVRKAIEEDLQEFCEGTVGTVATVATDSA